jgi:hypothetical protein
MLGLGRRRMRGGGPDREQALRWRRWRRHFATRLHGRGRWCRPFFATRQGLLRRRRWRRRPAVGGLRFGHARTLLRLLGLASVLPSPLVGPSLIVVALPVGLALATELGRLLPVVGPAARAPVIPVPADVVDLDASVEFGGIASDVGGGRVLRVGHLAVVLHRRGRDRLHVDVGRVGRPRVQLPGTANAASHDGRGDDCAAAAREHAGFESDHG